MIHTLLLANSPLHGAVAWTVDVGIIVLAAGMLLCLFRLLRGPHLADRAMAVDTLGVQLIGMIVLLSIRIGTITYFDGILVVSLLSFAGTVAMAQFIARPHVQPDQPARADAADHRQQETST